MHIISIAAFKSADKSYRTDDTSVDNQSYSTSEGSQSNQTSISVGSQSNQTSISVGSQSNPNSISVGNQSDQTNQSLESQSNQTNKSFGSQSDQTSISVGSQSNQTSILVGSQSYTNNQSLEIQSNPNSISVGSQSNETNKSFGSQSNQTNQSSISQSYKTNKSFGSQSNQNKTSDTTHEKEKGPFLEMQEEHQQLHNLRVLCRQKKMQYCQLKVKPLYEFELEGIKYTVYNIFIQMKVYFFSEDSNEIMHSITNNLSLQQFKSLVKWNSADKVKEILEAKYKFVSNEYNPSDPLNPNKPKADLYNPDELDQYAETFKKGTNMNKITKIVGPHTMVAMKKGNEGLKKILFKEEPINPEDFKRVSGLLIVKIKIKD